MAWVQETDIWNPIPSPSFFDHSRNCVNHARDINTTIVSYREKDGTEEETKTDSLHTTYQVIVLQYTLSAFSTFY
jgi:hypothetical protein